MEKLPTITIKEPYWSASKEFGWDKGVWGFGINENFLFGYGEPFFRIYSEYHKISYQVSREEAQREAKLCKNQPRGVKLYVIPMKILRPEVLNANTKMDEQGEQAIKVKATREKVDKKPEQDLFR